MKRSSILVSALVIIGLGVAAQAEPVPVRHPQHDLHKFLVARTEEGKTIASGEFSQSVQGDEVTMRLTYRFLDGSLDDELTTYRQAGTFKLIRSRHIQQGPFFPKQTDFAVEAATGTATTRTTDRNGKVHIENQHVAIPDDLANGFVGTLILNTPPDAKPYRVGMLAPVGGGHLIQLLISPDGEHSFQMAGETHKAMAFRIHPELGGIVGVLARLIGLLPKDVIVWIYEDSEPAVVKISGQLGGWGPIVNSELAGTSFNK